MFALQTPQGPVLAIWRYCLDYCRVEFCRSLTYTVYQIVYQGQDCQCTSSTEGVKNFNDSHFQVYLEVTLITIWMWIVGISVGMCIECIYSTSMDMQQLSGGMAGLVGSILWSVDVSYLVECLTSFECL